MNRRGFLLTAAAGTLGALTTWGLTEDIRGAATPAGRAQEEPTTSSDPGVAATPVLQRGAPAVSRTIPPTTVVSWVPDTPPLIALTIDDGVSSPVVSAYAELAKATGIRLTFFANGVNPSWADNRPQLQPMIDSGQIQIANHTWDHPDVRTLSNTQLIDQLDRNNRYLQNLYGWTPGRSSGPRTWDTPPPPTGSASTRATR